MSLSTAERDFFTRIIAPLPLGTDALSKSLNGLIISVPDVDETAYIREISASIREMNEKKAVENLNLLFEAMFKNSSGSKDILITQLYSDINSIIKQFETEISFEYSSKELLSLLKECGKFNTLYNLTKELLLKIICKNSDSKKSRDFFDIENVKNHINNNLDKNITLESAAKIACKNVYYFSVFFKKHTGQNFKEYILNCKMEKAMSLLNNTDKKIAEISELVGFGDYKHFSKTFKKYYNIRPGDVRKNNNKQKGE